MSVRGAVFAAKAKTVLRADDALWRELTANDRLDAEAMDRLRTQRFLAQARFAMTHTEYYRDLYRDAGITDDDLRDPAVLAELPIVEKADIREHGERFHSDEYTDRIAVRVATGGSTGKPLVMARDQRVRGRAFEWRLLGWWGIEPWVHTGIVQRLFRTPREAMLQQVGWWPSQRFFLDAFDMTPDTMEAFLARYRKVAPELLLGYVGGVLELARYVLDRGYELPPARAVTVIAAPVTEQQRATMTEAFGAPVYDHYRCAEANWMAGECGERAGLHTFDDIRNVELVGSDGRPVGPGERGEVVITDFTNRIFPLVRYRLGDISAPIEGPCPCGRPYRRIENVSGRRTDAIVLPDGRMLAGEGLAQIYSKVAECVDQFQLHQLADHSVVVRVIPTSHPDAVAAIEEKTEELRTMLEHEVPVTLELVDDIGHDGGKIRYVRSDVPTPATT